MEKQQPNFGLDKDALMKRSHTSQLEYTRLIGPRSMDYGLAYRLRVSE
jgi:hypothetical protein